MRGHRARHSLNLCAPCSGIRRGPRGLPSDFGKQSTARGHGVRLHAATREYASEVYIARGVGSSDLAIWNAIEHDNVLAAGLARLLLWSDPVWLPHVGDADGAWDLYLRTWRLGAFSRGNPAQRTDLRAKWGGSYAQAMAAVGGGWICGRGLNESRGAPAGRRGAGGAVQRLLPGACD